MPRPSHPKLSREAIARATLALVDRDGPDGASIRRVADRLNVHPTSLYNHVPNLAALIEARDPLRQAGDGLAARWRALAAFRNGRVPGYAHRGGLAAIDTDGAMLLAEKDGEPIGAHAFVRQADEAIWLSLATSDRHGDVPRSYPLLWAGMRRARDMGLIAYDLAGMPIDAPRDEGEGKRMQFKEAFAPTRRMLLPMQVAAVKPVAHAMLFAAREVYRGVKRRRRAAA